METGSTPDRTEGAAAPGAINRRGLLIKGALAGTGVAAGTFAPPRISALDLHANRAAAASSHGHDGQHGQNGH